MVSLTTHNHLLVLLYLPSASVNYAFSETILGVQILGVLVPKYPREEANRDGAYAYNALH